MHWCWKGKLGKRRRIFVYFLIFISDKTEFLLREYMSTTEWIQVLSTATQGSLDNEKVRVYKI